LSRQGVGWRHQVAHHQVRKRRQRNRQRHRGQVVAFIRFRHGVALVGRNDEIKAARGLACCQGQCHGHEVGVALSRSKRHHRGRDAGQQRLQGVAGRREIDPVGPGHGGRRGATVGHDELQLEGVAKRGAGRGADPGDPQIGGDDVQRRGREGGVVGFDQFKNLVSAVHLDAKIARTGPHGGHDDLLRDVEAGAGGDAACAGIEAHGAERNRTGTLRAGSQQHGVLPRADGGARPRVGDDEGQGDQGARLGRGRGGHRAGDQVRRRKGGEGQVTRKGLVACGVGGVNAVMIERGGEEAAQQEGMIRSEQRRAVGEPIGGIGAVGDAAGGWLGGGPRDHGAGDVCRGRDRGQHRRGAVHELIFRHIMQIGGVGGGEGLDKTRVGRDGGAAQSESLESVIVRRGVGHGGWGGEGGGLAVGERAGSRHRCQTRRQGGCRHHVLQVGFRVMRAKQPVAVKHDGEHGVAAEGQPVLGPVAELVAEGGLGGDEVGAAPGIHSCPENGPRAGGIIRSGKLKSGQAKYRRERRVLVQNERIARVGAADHAALDPVLERVRRLVRNRRGGHGHECAGGVSSRAGECARPGRGAVERQDEPLRNGKVGRHGVQFGAAVAVAVVLEHLLVGIGCDFDQVRSCGAGGQDGLAGQGRVGRQARRGRVGLVENRGGRRLVAHPHPVLETRRRRGGAPVERVPRQRVGLVSIGSGQQEVFDPQIRVISQADGQRVFGGGFVVALQEELIHRIGMVSLRDQIEIAADSVREIDGVGNRVTLAGRQNPVVLVEAQNQVVFVHQRVGGEHHAIEP